MRTLRVWLPLLALVCAVAAPGCGGSFAIESSSDDFGNTDGGTGGGGGIGGPVGGSTVFLVRDGGKPATHPDFNVGCNCSWWIDNRSGATLNLIRGVTYEFEIFAPGHAFYFTTDRNGGAGAPGRLTDGVFNDLIGVGTVQFTPGPTLPAQFYYQCAVHPNMGWQVNLTP